MSLLSILASITGIAMGLGNFPQAIRIFRRKSAKDISIWTFSILFVGSVIWVLYGIEIGDFPIVISYLAGMIPIAAILVGWFMYGK